MAGLVGAVRLVGAVFLVVLAAGLEVVLFEVFAEVGDFAAGFLVDDDEVVVERVEVVAGFLVAGFLAVLTVPVEPVLGVGGRERPDDLVLVLAAAALVEVPAGLDFFDFGLADDDREVEPDAEGPLVRDERFLVLVAAPALERGAVVVLVRDFVADGLFGRAELGAVRLVFGRVEVLVVTN